MPLEPAPRRGLAKRLRGGHFTPCGSLTASSEAPIRRRRIALPEDRAPGDEEVGSCGPRLADRLRVDAAVHLQTHVRRQGLPQRADPRGRLGHVRLAGVAGMDRHAEHEVGALRGADRLLDRGLRVQSHADTEPEGARVRDRAQPVLDRLDVERDAVPARPCERLEVPLRPLDHQVAVERRSPRVDEWSDRGDHDRADRDLRDEVAVSGVEVEDAGARLHQRSELLAEAREVGGVDRRLDLHLPCPLAPAHVPTLTHVGEPMVERGGTHGSPAGPLLSAAG